VTSKEVLSNVILIMPLPLPISGYEIELLEEDVDWIPVYGDEDVNRRLLSEREPSVTREAF
jgi:hypothetical protein